MSKIKTSYSAPEARMTKLNERAVQHNKTLTGMIDQYVALGMMLEELLEKHKGGEVVIADATDIEKLKSKTVVPVRFLIEAG